MAEKILTEDETSEIKKLFKSYPALLDFLFEPPPGRNATDDPEVDNSPTPDLPTSTDSQKEDASYFAVGEDWSSVTAWQYESPKGHGSNRKKKRRELRHHSGGTAQPIASHGKQPSPQKTIFYKTEAELEIRRLHDEVSDLSRHQDDIAVSVGKLLMSFRKPVAYVQKKLGMDPSFAKAYIHLYLKLKGKAKRSLVPCKTEPEKERALMEIRRLHDEVLAIRRRLIDFGVRIGKLLVPFKESVGDANWQFFVQENLGMHPGTAANCIGHYQNQKSEAA